MGSQVKGKVLLTGGSGFIASHVLDNLLDEGFQVVATVRSEEKGRRILDSIKPAFDDDVSFVVVEDIAKEGAFDAAVLSNPPFDYVVHTASPYHFNVQDPVKDFLDPAINGTIGLLKSVKAHAPTVKRIVITSSSAAMINPGNHAKVYDETIWAQITWEEAMDPRNTYRASKVFAEKAAWKFVDEESPSFDLAVINNTYTFGPVPRHLRDPAAMNASNHRIRDMLQGRMRAALPPTIPLFTFVDVRDVALAHARALTAPGAGGRRIYVVGGHFSNKRIADAVRRARPDLACVLPPEDAEDDLPSDVYGFDNGRSRDVLGLEYTALEKCVEDTVRSIMDSGMLD